MAIEFKDIFIRVRSDFTDATRGFSAARREIDDIGQAANRASKEAGALFESARRLSRQDFALKFDLDATRNMLDELREIDTALGNLERRKISVDPKARQEAEKARLAIQDQIAVYEQLVSTAESAFRKEGRAAEQASKIKRSIRRYELIEEKKALSDLQAARLKAHRDNLRLLQQQASERARISTSFIQEDLRGELRRTSRDVGGIGRVLASAATAADSWGNRLDAAAGVLTRLSPILRGVTILVGTTLVGAFAALAAGISAAVAGLAAAATSFMAALGPIFALFVGFMSRLGAIMQAVKAHGDAARESQQNAANSARVEADQLERVRNAANAVTDATQNLANANDEAAEAAADLERAEVDALREIEDAAERASDAVRDLESAHLGVAEANLNLEEAELRLKELGKEAGLTGPAIEDMFQKFTNVDLRDTGRLKELMAEAEQQAGGGAAGLDFRQGLLDVAQAKLGIKEANDRVSDSEREVQDTQRESLRLQKEGIAGTDVYRSALERVESANLAVRDAEERLTESHRDQRDALRDQRVALEGTTTAMDEYKRQLADLSPAERQFARDLIGVGKVLRTIVQEGTDPLFVAFHDLLPLFAAFVPYLRQLAGTLGNDAADNLRELAGQLVSMANLKRISVLGDLSTDLARTLGGPVLQDFAQGLLNIASGAAPIVRDILGRIVTLMEQFRASTEGFGEGSAGFELLRSGVEALLDLIENLARVWVNFTKAAGPLGVEFVQWIADGAEALSDFISSEEGSESITRFLETAIPFAKSLIRFLLKVADAGFEVFEFLAPFLTDLFDGLTVIATVIDEVFEVLNHIPGWLRSLIVGIILPFGLISKLGTVAIKLPGLLAKAFGLGANLIRVPIGLIVGAITSIGTAWEWVIGAIDDAWEWIKNAFNDAVDWIKDFLQIGSPSGLFIEIGESIVEGLLEGVRGLAQSLFNAGRWLVRGFLRAIRFLAQAVFDAGKWIVEELVAAIRSTATFLYRAGKWVVDRLIEGVKKVVRLILDLGKWVLDKLWQGMKDAVRVITDAANWVIDQIVNGIKAAGDRLVGWGRWIAGKIKEGIVEKPLDLLEWLVNPLAKAGDTAGKAFSDVGNYFGQMFTAGLGGGIKEGAPGPARQVREVGEGMFNVMARTLKVRSPSQVMHYIGLMTMKGLAQGIRDGVGDVHSTLTKAAGPGALSALVGDVSAGVNVTPLAKGGILKRPVFAAGEAGREAVIPLTRSVYSQLAGAITSAMAMSRPPSLSSTGIAVGQGVAGTMTGGGYTIQKMDVILPPAPGHEQMGDPRHQAAQFARELSRRGSRTVGGGGFP